MNDGPDNSNTLPASAPPMTPALRMSPYVPVVVPAPAGYRIICPLGEGGMGIVYRAEDTALQRPVALKYLRPEFAADAHATGRFLHEARITARLQHPGIPPVHEVGNLWDGRPFLAMKLVEGQTLFDLLRKQGPGAARWLGVFEAICQAVGYAHSRGVIHRDLKPSNIMVGAFGEVQVMDWGLAKYLGHRDGVTEFDASVTQPSPELQWTPVAMETHAGSVLGTPAFMPPEQALGAIDRVDQRSDVFGLGAILCALLTGEPPYIGPDTESTHQLAAGARLDDAYVRLEKCDAGSDLVALVKRCLSPEPSARFADAGELAAEVARLRHQAEERARQAELQRALATAQATEQRRYRKRIQAVAAALIAVLLAGIVGTSVGLYWANSNRRDALARRDEAVTARELARARYRQALEAYNQLVFGIQNKLDTRPGTLELSKDLLDHARKGLRDLLREAERQGTPDSTLIWAYFRLGDVEKSLGNTTEALTNYRAGHDLAERLAQDDPNDTEAQTDLAISYERFGDVALQQGQPKDALERYTQSHDILARLATADPKNPRTQRNLSVCTAKLGDAAIRLGQPEKGFDHYKRGRDLLLELAKDPTNTQAQRDLGAGYDRLGDAALRLGKIEEAQGYYRQSHEILSRLAKDDPKHVQARRDIGVSDNRLGDLALRLGHIEEAFEHYKRSHDVLLNLSKDDPKNAEVQRTVGLSFEKLGNVALQLGLVEEAIAHHKQSRDVFQRLVQGDAKNAEFQHALSVAYEKLGDIRLRLEQPKEALEYYTQSHIGFLRLAKEVSSNAQAQRALGVSYHKLGDARLKLGQPEEAIRQYKKCLEIRSRLAKDDSGNAEAQSHFALTADALGDAVLQRKQVGEAIGYYKQSLEVRERLAKRDLNDFEAQLALYLSYLHLGVAEKARHDYDQATEWFMRGRAVMLPMHEKKLLVGSVKDAIAVLDKELALCKDADRAIRNLGFALAQKEPVHLLDIRVRALLHRGHLGDAIKTAECWRDLVAKRDKDFDARYDTACALALCAAVDTGTRQTLLVRKCVTVLTGLRDAGYFKDAKNLAHFAQDADFDGIRKHADFAAFAASLQQKFEAIREG